MSTTMTAWVDTVRRVQDGVNRDGVAGAFEAAQSAYNDASKTNANGSAGIDLNKWLIIIAAVFGAFMLYRGLRKITGFAFAIFWIWFATHGFRF